MARNDKSRSGKCASLLALCLFAAVCAAPLAQAQTQPETVFGQKVTQPALLNRMFGGASSEPVATSQAGAPAPGQPAGSPSPSSPASASRAPSSAQQAAQQAAADEGTNGDSPFPKRYLFNKMFSRESLGLEPETPAPATAPAAKTP